ncbi:MAG: four helix bundle protein [Candidatus Margulisbacteria bacterium]|nr:four helix bundle protein [Candidatus Margulisiibacteriota bacterium]
MKEFTELRVWQEGKSITVSIYKLTEKFPGQERFGLTDQLRRAANSVCANIAEGFERYHTKDKIRFYYLARGSAAECKSHLLISKELGYLSEETTKNLIEQCSEIGRMINAMITAIRE